MLDARTIGLIGGILLLLGIATAVVRILKNRPNSGVDAAILTTFQLRVRAWWLLFAVLAAAFVLGKGATVILFWLIAFWALREFITLTPTRPGDHRALFWVFFLFTPLQFVLVWFNLYKVYSVLIPVYGFLFITARIAMEGDRKRFLERMAKIQAGMLICVYFLSYAPAIVTLDLPGEAKGRNVGLLLFFVLIVQLSDALQYAWAQIPSRHVIVPAISPNRTWEGLLGGGASVALVGMALYWATPFPFYVAGLLSLVMALTGFCGGLTMSAIKRDRGVKDYGTLVEGHSGVLDRVDSLCFSAPVFFHFVLWLV